MKTKITKELFDEAVELEDSMIALAGGFYDTHDLSYIEEHKEEYKNRLLQLRKMFKLKEGDYFVI